VELPVSNVVNLKKAKQRRAEGKTLCGSGFHKWHLLTQQRFDVKQGKLVSTQRCQRCGEQRSLLT
jgi:hypothetical protein